VVGERETQETAISAATRAPAEEPPKLIRAPAEKALLRRPSKERMYWGGFPLKMPFPARPKMVMKTTGLETTRRITAR
jgi:hypothetical protein